MTYGQPVVDLDQGNYMVSMWQATLGPLKEPLPELTDEDFEKVNWEAIRERRKKRRKNYFPKLFFCDVKIPDNKRKNNKSSLDFLTIFNEYILLNQ